MTIYPFAKFDSFCFNIKDRFCNVRVIRTTSTKFLNMKLNAASEGNNGLKRGRKKLAWYSGEKVMR